MKNQCTKPNCNCVDVAEKANSGPVKSYECLAGRNIDYMAMIVPSRQKSKVDKHKMLTDMIAEGMRQNNLNKGEFAKLMTVQPSIITRWLSGSHNFTIETLIKIENNLSIKLLNV